MHYRNKVLLARTMAVCGIVMSAIAARPAHAESPPREHRTQA